MKRILSLILSMFLLVSIFSTSVFAVSSKSNWNDAKVRDCYYSIDMIWNEPLWGLNSEGEVTVSIIYFLDDDYNDIYGEDISSVDEVKDDVDFIARTIFAECINVKPRIENAFAIAQVIKNRADSDGKSPKEIVSNSGHFNATGERAFKMPSDDRYDPEGWSENISQEELWIYCVYLAKCLDLGYEIPLETDNGYRQEHIDVGSAYNFHDVADYNPFYEYGNKSGKVDFSKYDDGDIVTQANYFNGTKLTKKPIKIGNHVYYTR